MESKREILLYISGKDFQIDDKLQNETVWLSQKLMANLFQKDSDTIGLHI